MKMGMLRYPISEILVDRLTSGKRPESCNYFERGEVKAFGTATSYELQGDYCSPVEAESGFLRLCALGSGAFFDFSIGIWQRERTNLLYARRPGFLMCGLRGRAGGRPTGGIIFYLVFMFVPQMCL